MKKRLEFALAILSTGLLIGLLGSTLTYFALLYLLKMQLKSVHVMTLFTGYPFVVLFFALRMVLYRGLISTPKHVPSR